MNYDHDKLAKDKACIGSHKIYFRFSSSSIEILV